jgi:phosphopantothenoylcysteine decarboxylase/phosphopantothenate--cysteine ligase
MQAGTLGYIQQLEKKNLRPTPAFIRACTPDNFIFYSAAVRVCMTPSWRMNMQKPIVLCGISGGIAAYKAADLVSRLHKSEVTVRVVKTPSAQRFVQRSPSRPFSAHPSAPKCSATPPPRPARVFIHTSIPPAGRSFSGGPRHGRYLGQIGARAGGRSRLASALGLSRSCVKVFCPAMNTNMWNQPAFRRM